MNNRRRTNDREMLKIRRETIRQLSSLQIRSVQGGAESISFLTICRPTSLDPTSCCTG